MITFHLSDGFEFSLSNDKARAFLESPEQIMMIADEEGKWTGTAINKAFLIRSERGGESLSHQPQLPEDKPNWDLVVRMLDKLRHEKPWEHNGEN